MNTVSVKRVDVLKRVEENRERHHKAVAEAQEEYRKEVIQHLDAMLRDAREGKRLRTRVELVMPVDHTRDYDRVIDQLKMSVDDVIDLQEYEFAQYVRDEWEWDAQFARANNRYARSAGTQAYFAGKLGPSE